MRQSDAAPTKDRRILVGVFVIALLLGGISVFLRMGYQKITICKKPVSAATAVALESAVNNFHIEYDSLPSTESSVTTNTPEGIKFLTILLGMDEKSAHPKNIRAIKFLSVREGKDNRNGLIYPVSRDSVQGLFDNWGNPYTVVFNVEDREELNFTKGSKTYRLKGRRCIAYSAGPDLRLGTSDDVTTW